LLYDFVNAYISDTLPKTVSVTVILMTLRQN